MSSILDLALGIMSALGGFVDIGELVFTAQGGAKFGYMLIWTVVVGTIGIIVYGEMAGRIAAVLQKPTFQIIREQGSYRSGLITLIASNIVNLLTCTAEIGGIAIVLQLLFGLEYRLMLVAATGLLCIAIYFMKFEWLERVFGLMGLALLVYAGAAVVLNPDWGAVAKGFLPQVPEDNVLVYFYYVVGLFSSIVMPYEIYFYSSGAIEDKWTVKDLPTNVLTATVGFTLGGLLAIALIVGGATFFASHGVVPDTLSSTALPATAAFGIKGLLLALLGMLFAIGGAAVETALAGAYNVTQFFGLAWGKDKRLKNAPVFHATWLVLIGSGFAIAMSGVNPVLIVEYSVVFAVVVLPFTYYPILQTARDKKLMKGHANSPMITAAGWVYFAIITMAAVSAIPLMIVTHMGEG